MRESQCLTEVKIYSPVPEIKCEKVTFMQTPDLVYIRTCHRSTYTSTVLPYLSNHIHTHVYELTFIWGGGGDGAGLTGDTAARTLTCVANIYSAKLNSAALLPNSVITTEQLWLNMGLCGGLMFFNEPTCCRYRTTAPNPVAVTTFNICRQMIYVPPSSLIRAIICSKPCMSSVWQHLDWIHSHWCWSLFPKTP